MILHIFISIIPPHCFILSITAEKITPRRGDIPLGWKQTQYKLINYMSDNYGFEIDEDEHLPAFQQRSKIQHPAIQARTQAKYHSKTITKGFFNGESSLQIEDYDPEESTDTIGKIPIKNTEEKQSGEPQRKRRSRREQIKLQPLKQKEKVDVFSNFVRPTEQYAEETEEISGSKCMKKQEDRSDKVENSENKRRSHRRKVEKKQTKQEERIIESSPDVQISKIERTHDIMFADQEEDAARQNQQPTGPPVQMPLARQVNQVFFSSDEETIEVPNQEQGTEPLQLGSKYFTYNPSHLFKKQLREPVRQGQTLSLQVIRDKQGFNTFWPQFHLNFKCDNHHVMSAKKTSSKPSSTFIISTNRYNYEENSEYYMGKMKSNMLGDVMNIFGPGLSPSNAKERNVEPRELLATVVFITSIFQMGKPRQFIVYVKKAECKYYTSFPQVRRYEEEISLDKLYQYSENKQKIEVYANRKPEWLESISGYILNFKGRVDCPSIKNFILEDKPNGKDLVIFGKITDSRFNMDVSHPISPYLAFAIALTSFDSRIMIE